MLIVRVTLFRFHQVKLAHKSVSAQKSVKYAKGRKRNYLPVNNVVSFVMRLCPYFLSPLMIS